MDIYLWMSDKMINAMNSSTSMFECKDSWKLCCCFTLNRSAKQGTSHTSQRVLARGGGADDIGTANSELAMVKVLQVAEGKQSLRDITMELAA